MKTKMSNGLKTLSLILLTIVVISSLMSIVSYAADFCPICQVPHLPSPKGPAKLAYTMHIEGYGGRLFYSETNNGALTTEGVLRFDVQSSEFKTLWDTAEGFYNIVATLGELLCVIYAMVRIIEMTTDDTMTPEKLAFIIMKMCIGIIIIKNGFEMITQGMNLASIAFNNISQTPTGPGVNTGCNYDEMVKAGFFEAIDDIFALFLPYLLMSAAKLIISVVCWARILDIVIRTVFAPIGMADFMFEGMNGHGFIYLKKMIASALQATVIMAVTRGYAILVNMTSGAGGWFTIIILAYTMIMITFKTQSLANDVIGA